MTLEQLDNKVMFAIFLESTGLNGVTIHANDNGAQTLTYSLSELYNFAPLLVNDLKAAFEKEIARCEELCRVADGEGEGLAGED